MNKLNHSVHLIDKYKPLNTSLFLVILQQRVAALRGRHQARIW